MHRYVCPECGANLDPGEHCDCIELKTIEVRRKERPEKKPVNIFVIEKNGQLKLAI